MCDSLNPYAVYESALPHTVLKILKPEQFQADVLKGIYRTCIQKPIAHFLLYRDKNRIDWRVIRILDRKRQPDVKHKYVNME